MDAADDAGGGADVDAAASVAASTGVELRAFRGGREEGIPGDEISEDSAVGSSNAAATEKRGLYNLIVPAPTTPEMIRKERRQDNGNSIVCISLYRTLGGERATTSTIDARSSHFVFQPSIEAIKLIGAVASNADGHR